MARSRKLAGRRCWWRGRRGRTTGIIAQTGCHAAWPSGIVPGHSQSGGIRHSHGRSRGDGRRCRCRRARRPVWSRPVAPRTSNDARPGACSRGLDAQNLATIPDPRPSARLSTQDQLIRRLGPTAMGSLYPRARDLWRQQRRTDPPEVRRRQRQPALSPPTSRNARRHVADL